MSCWIVLVTSLLVNPAIRDTGESAGLTIRILEGIPDKKSWEFERPLPVEQYDWPASGRSARCSLTAAIRF
jgi:hypothetical protein